MTTRAQLAKALTLGAALALLAGCGGMKIRGVVLSGPIGRAMVVDARDQRLTTTGVEGVEVQLVRPGAETGGGIAPLASATTGPDGRFEITVSEKEKLRGQVVVLADSAGIFRTRTVVYPPRQGQEILVQVRERGRSASADTSP